MSLKTPTNVKECHLLVMKFFLNILEAYQDFRFVGVMFSRAIYWLTCVQIKLIQTQSHFK